MIGLNHRGFGDVLAYESGGQRPLVANASSNNPLSRLNTAKMPTFSFLGKMFLFKMKQPAANYSSMCRNADWCGPHVWTHTVVLVLHGLLIISAVIMCVWGMDGRGLCAADGSSMARLYLHYHNNRPQPAPAAQEQHKSASSPPPTHRSVCSITSAFTHSWLILIIKHQNLLVL